MPEVDGKHLVRCDHIENRKLALHPFAGNGRVRGKQRRQLDKQGGFRFAAQVAQRIETADIRMLLERKPDEVRAWMELAELADQQGDTTEARRAASEALRLAPGLLPARELLEQLNSRRSPRSTPLLSRP